MYFQGPPPPYPHSQLSQSPIPAKRIKDDGAGQPELMQNNIQASSQLHQNLISRLIYSIVFNNIITSALQTFQTH